MLIQRLRDGSDGILAKVIVGLIIIVFGLFGFGSITSSLAPVPKVASVNGEDVTQQDMEIAVERNRRALQVRGVSIDEINEDELRANVLQGLISREVLSQAVQELDLYYGDSLIDAQITANSSFLVDDVFSPNQFVNVIQSAGYTPLVYRDQIRKDGLFKQLFKGLAESAFVTEAEGRRLSSLLSQTRDIAYLRIKTDDLIDKVTVTDEEIADYYAERKEEFLTKEIVSLQYVELKHELMAAELDIKEGVLEQYFIENESDYSTDEARRLAHILIETKAEVSVEQARLKALEIYDRIKLGEKFSRVAEQESDDAGSRGNGGDLGFNPLGTFLPEFEAAAYKMSLNGVSEPVKTAIGYHVIKVLEIEEGIVPAFSEVRGDVENRYRMAATEEAFVANSSRLAELLFESADLVGPSEELGLTIKSTGDLSRESSNFLMRDKSVVRAAFSPDVLVDGNNSDLLELTDSHHVGLRVEKHLPVMAIELQEVEEDIRGIIQRDKAESLANARALEIVEKIRGGSLSQYVANEYGLVWARKLSVSRSSKDIEPFILKEVFKLPKPGHSQESLGSFTVSGGDSYVLRLSRAENRSSLELTESEILAVRQNLALQFGRADFQELETSLIDEASVQRFN